MPIRSTTHYSKEQWAIGAMGIHFWDNQLITVQWDIYGGFGIIRIWTSVQSPNKVKKKTTKWTKSLPPAIHPNYLEEHK